MGIIEGKVYVLGDNIDTDQIIPAHHLNLVPTVPEEYRALGRQALSGVPHPAVPFIAPGADTSVYPIIIAGRNFGCGSSREHAPVALGAAGVKVVVAESFARIFFRNCIATGEVYPVECTTRLSSLFATGSLAAVDIETHTLVNRTTGERHQLRPLGEARAVIDAGGLFAYARAQGLIRT
jgi:3-isopropylmalate/(R)-2-methylmalate dehydratase small subunit